MVKLLNLKLSYLSTNILILAVENKWEKFLHQEKTYFNKIYKFDLSDIKKYLYLSVWICSLVNTLFQIGRDNLQRGVLVRLKLTICIKGKYFDKNKQNQQKSVWGLLLSDEFL